MAKKLGIAWDEIPRDRRLTMAESSIVSEALYNSRLNIRVTEVTPENAISLHDEFDEVLYGDASCDNNNAKPGGKTDICGIGGVRMTRVKVKNRCCASKEDEGMDVDAGADSHSPPEGPQQTPTGCETGPPSRGGG